jgi:hypothetical protein
LDSSLYEVRVQRATPAERRYMRGMAELGSGPYRSGAVAKKLGKSPAALSQLRDRLIGKGLIYATEDFGHLDFSVPRFDEFMRRYMEYKAPPKSRTAKSVRSGRLGFAQIEATIETTYPNKHGGWRRVVRDPRP